MRAEIVSFHFIYSSGSFQTWINVWEPFQRFVDDNISYFEDISISFLVYYVEIIFISFPVFIYLRGSFQTWINVWEPFRRFVDDNISYFEDISVSSFVYYAIIMK